MSGLVDRALRDNTDFGAMDFATRDRYRRAVERIAAPARRWMRSRSLTRSVERARRAVGKAPRESDPGFYLIGGGALPFEKQIGYRPSLRQRFWRGAAATGLVGYLGFSALVTTIVIALILAVEFYAGVTGRDLATLGFLAILPAADLAIATVNRNVTNRWGPKCLPALSLKEGVPDSLGTLLVVPVLITRANDIVEQVARLEVHYLSNADARLKFVLLSDWADSETETAPSDQPLLDQLRTAIGELNARYAENPPLFMLMHRRRLWNAAQGKWMGWERKRGKLHELNRLLRGANDTSFLDLDRVLGTSCPKDVRYVITVDADTRLPRGAAKRLIGKMAHPPQSPTVRSEQGQGWCTVTPSCSRA